MMETAPIDWLLEGEPWIVYRTRLDLLGEIEQRPQVTVARQAMLADARLQGLLSELAAWPGVVLSSHKSANQAFHKLTFIVDMGCKAGDPGVDDIASAVMKRQSREGPFQLPMNISTAHGGAGQGLWAWALCDAPLIVYALVKMGLQDELPVRTAVEYLAGLARPNGWPCVVSKELGSFRGPGRKEDPCPFATLVMLKLLAQLDEWRDSQACRDAAHTLLTLWEQSMTSHPYIFYMGADFRKLKVPFVWYDLMHVLEVLSQFPWLRDDPRLLDMLNVLQSKADAQGRFTLESVWMAWKNWEFGQKKAPSRWLTLMAWRILRRMEQS